MEQEKGRFKTQIVKLNNGEAVIKVVQRNGEAIDFLIDSENIPLVRGFRWFCRYFPPESYRHPAQIRHPPLWEAAEGRKGGGNMACSRRR